MWTQHPREAVSVDVGGVGTFKWSSLRSAVGQWEGSAPLRPAFISCSVPHSVMCAAP